MFSRDRLITGVIGRKLDENWPNLAINLLFANRLASVSPLANNRFTTKFSQFSSNLRLITPAISLSLENILTFTPREV